MPGDQSDNPRQEGLPFKEVLPGGVELSATKDRTPSVERVIGEVIDGRYQLLSAIGQGGMGYVYKAKQLTTGRTLAIKMLSSKASATDAHMIRFQQEAKAACAFSHPNAVHVYDFGITSDGVPYLTMQYVEGQTMSDEIAHNGALAQERALLIFQQIASALSAAHEQHVLHRDIKPSNIMLVPIKEPPHISAMLLDFGIAKFDDPEQLQMGLTKTGEVFGTPFYMSPEQCKGQKLDQRSDIYSLGCVMYEALTGVPPFYGENFLQTLHRHINDDPKPLTAMRTNGSINPSLQSTILKCLAKEPAERFQSMDELKRALRNEEVPPPASLQNFSTSKSAKFDNNERETRTLPEAVQRNTLVQVSSSRTISRKQWTAYAIAAACVLAILVAVILQLRTRSIDNLEQEGVELYKAKHYTQAISVLREAFDRGSNDKFRHLNDCYMNVHNYAGSESICSTLIQRAETNKDKAMMSLGHESLADVYLDTGKTSAAVAEARRAFELGRGRDPGAIANLYLFVAKCCDRNKNYPESIEWNTKGLEFLKAHAVQNQLFDQMLAHYQIGLSRQQIGKNLLETGDSVKASLELLKAKDEFQLAHQIGEELKDKPAWLRDIQDHLHEVEGK